MCGKTKIKQSKQAKTIVLSQYTRAPVIKYNFSESVCSAKFSSVIKMNGADGDRLQLFYHMLLYSIAHVQAP